MIPGVRVKSLKLFHGGTRVNTELHMGGEQRDGCCYLESFSELLGRRRAVARLLGVGASHLGMPSHLVHLLPFCPDESSSFLSCG